MGTAGLSTATGRWRRWLKTELGGEKWSVAYAPLGVTRHKSSQDEYDKLTTMQSQRGRQ